MRRSVPRALLTAALVAATAGCAAGGGAGVDLGGDTGGRYLVMIPDFEGPDGDRVAEDLRGYVSEMTTHTAINRGSIRSSMSEYDLESLDEISARQLASIINAYLVSWGTITPAGDGLEADVKFVDTRSGDEIVLEDISAATAPELAAAIFSSFERSVEGIRQAAFCNDYLSSNQYDQALETCENALAIVPNSATALYGKATALLYLDRPQDALNIYDELLDVDPMHQDALLGAGLAASRLDQSQDAMAYYNRYLEINPGNVAVRITVANDVAETGDYVSAFRVLETALDDEEASANADFQRYLFSIATAAGQRLMEQGDSANSIGIFETALAAYEKGFAEGDGPSASQIRQAIAVNNSLGRRDDAIRIARDATQRYPDDPQIWSQLATVYTQAGQHTDAIDALDRVIQIDENYENVYIRRAQAYFENGQRQQALADLERAADLGSRETVAQVLYGMGAEELRAERWSDATGLLELALDYANGDNRSDIAYFLGFSLFRQAETIARPLFDNPDAGQAQRALDLFNRSVQTLGQTTNPQRQQLIDASQQFMEAMQAIARAR